MDYVVYDGTAAFAPASEIFGVYDAVFHEGSDLTHWLDSPWPKLLRTRAALTELVSWDRIEPEALFGLLADRRPAETE